MSKKLLLLLSEVSAVCFAEEISSKVVADAMQVCFGYGMLSERRHEG